MMHLRKERCRRRDTGAFVVCSGYVGKEFRGPRKLEHGLEEDCPKKTIKVHILLKVDEGRRLALLYLGLKAFPGVFMNSISTACYLQMTYWHLGWGEWLRVFLIRNERLCVLCSNFLFCYPIMYSSQETDFDIQ